MEIFYKSENNKIPLIIIEEIKKELSENNTFIKLENFNNYINKVETHAKMISFVDSNKKIQEVYGFCIYYCNDYKNLTGFITLIIINKNHRNKGYGEKLLNYVIKDIKNNGFNKLSLNVNKYNKKAIKLYKKKGFVETELNDDEYKMILKL